MNLLTQLNRAMAYVEEHITDDLALADVSKVTSYSEYHFGRLFYYIADMPLSEYIRKRKLSLAAIELQSGREKVIDLAIKYGYDSADSFTRAFTRQHGITPSGARKQGIMLVNFPPMSFQIKIEGVQGMNWRIEQKAAFEVVGVERRFKNDETDLISGFWGEKSKDGSLERLKKQTGRSDFMGVCGHMDEAKGDFLYMIGLLSDKSTDTGGFSVIKAPAATWAIFRSEELDSNPYGAEIPKLFQSAYKEWLPSSGYEKLEGRDGEIYDMEFYGVTDNGKYFEEVWLSVAKG
ncbi:MAG: AraC family transcriptional regulator [Oscillospiraceae bacterium]|jgi:AraC family transcriptional regulator|nr:AraC family transcriptional regulator [Oscillospiraceae bacterium]